RIADALDLLPQVDELLQTHADGGDGMIEVDSADMVPEDRVRPSAGAHDLAGDGHGQVEQALFVGVASLPAAGNPAEAGWCDPAGSGHLAPVLPAQSLRVTQVSGAGHSGEDAGAQRRDRTHAAEGHRGLTEA